MSLLLSSSSSSSSSHHHGDNSKRKNSNRVAMVCPYYAAAAAAISDDDDDDGNSNGLDTTTTTTGLIFSEARKKCPAFANNAPCPFRDVSTNPELFVEVMKTVPPSHYSFRSTKDDDTNDDNDDETIDDNTAVIGKNANTVVVTTSTLHNHSSAAKHFQLAMEHVHHVASALMQNPNYASSSSSLRSTGEGGNTSYDDDDEKEKTKIFPDHDDNNNNNDNVHGDRNNITTYSNFIIPGGCPFKAYHQHRTTLSSSSMSSDDNKNDYHTKSSFPSTSSSSLSSSRQLHLAMVRAMEDFSVSAIMGRMATATLKNNHHHHQDDDYASIQPTTIRDVDEHRKDDDYNMSDQNIHSTTSSSSSSSAQNLQPTNTVPLLSLPSERPSLLSRAFKSGTAKSHTAAENVHFVHNFIQGNIDRELYREMIAGLYHIYRTLEPLLQEYAPLYFPTLHFPIELNRIDSLREDMEYWHGYDWESKRECITPTPAVRDYIERMHEISRCDPLLLLSHAYTRYLGDLSGGKVLSRIARRALNLGRDDTKNTNTLKNGTTNKKEDGSILPIQNNHHHHHYDGLQFYNFIHVPSAKLFKDMYRKKLDELPLSSHEISKLVAEANVAFALNMRVFEELDVKGGVVGARVRDVSEALSYYDIERSRGDDDEVDDAVGREGTLSSSSSMDDVVNDGEKKCPFGFGSGPNPHQSLLVVQNNNKLLLTVEDDSLIGASTKKLSSQAEENEGRCPWPFIFFHDPLTGVKDWQTWFVIGLALCYAWSYCWNGVI